MKPSLIRRNYRNSRHPSSFSGLSKVKKQYGKTVTLRTIKSALQKVHSYGMHKEVKKPYRRNPYFIYKKRQQIQIDLIDVRNRSEDNGGVQYLLTAIDMFTKKFFCAPMKSKNAKATLEALEEMLNFYDEHPIEVLSDRGSEFKNQAVRSFFKDRNIRHTFSNSDLKCAGVERMNKTIQGKIYKYMTENGTERFLDVLDDLVESYNNTYHRTIKMTPNEAEKLENWVEVRSNLGDFYYRKKPKSRDYKLGDLVRVAKMKDKFQRSYKSGINPEIFIINNVNTTMPIPMYELKSIEKNDILEGRFYAQELSPVKALRIEILNYKPESKEVQVKWLDRDPQTKSWIKAEYIDNART